MAEFDMGMDMYPSTSVHLIMHWLRARLPSIPGMGRCCEIMIPITGELSGTLVCTRRYRHWGLHKGKVESWSWHGHDEHHKEHHIIIVRWKI